MNTLLSQILPAELLQTDEFLEIPEAEALHREPKQPQRVHPDTHGLLNTNPYQQDLNVYITQQIFAGSLRV